MHCLSPASDTRLTALIRRRSADGGSRPFLTDMQTGRALGYSALAGATGGYGDALDGIGVFAGGRVLIDVADPIDFGVAYVGVIATGRCAVPANPRGPVAELARHAARTTPSAVIADRRERVTGLGVPVIEPRTVGERSQRPPGGVARLAPPLGSALLLTSGSTSAPKAVELAEDRLLHVARAVAVHHELTAQDRGFSPLPLFHVNGEVVALLATLRAGAELVLDRSFHRHGFWEALAEREVTWLNLVPAILTILAEHELPARPRRLRFIRSASAPLPVAVRDRIEGLVHVPVIESYGMTEAASQITAAPLHGARPAGSCGRPVATEVEVRDLRRRPLPPGEVGEIWIRGPGVIGAYDGDRGAERFDAHGWLDSGDRGRFDEDGYLYLSGRSDDVINRGGEMLDPREIEEVLAADPGVREAIVVGRADAILGEVPLAYIVPADGATAGLPDALATRCARELTRAKVPAEFRVVGDLPRGTTGKVARGRIAAAAADREPVPAGGCSGR